MKKIVCETSMEGEVNHFDVSGIALNVIGYPISATNFIQFDDKADLIDIRQKIFIRSFENFTIKTTKAPDPNEPYVNVIVLIAETEEEKEFIFNNDYLTAQIIGWIRNVEAELSIIRTEQLNLLKKIVNNTADIANGTTTNTQYFDSEYDITDSIDTMTLFPDME